MNSDRGPGKTAGSYANMSPAIRMRMLPPALHHVNPRVYGGQHAPNKKSRFFVIKSYEEDDVHKSLKYGVWASTNNGNRKLDAVGLLPCFLCV